MNKKLSTVAIMTALLGIAVQLGLAEEIMAQVRQSSRFGRSMRPSRYAPSLQTRTTSSGEEVVYVDDFANPPMASNVPPLPGGPYPGEMVPDGLIPEDVGDMGFGPPCDSPDCLQGYARYAHRTSVFGEFLYLRARDVEVTYAAPVDGPTTPPGNPADPGNQVGPLGMVDPDYESAYRVGFTRAMDDCSSIRASYTSFESHSSNAVSIDPGEFIQSLVTHPGVTNAADNWQEARATLDVDFKLADVEYRWLVSCSDTHAINLLAGARYGNTDQNFRSHFAISGTRDLATDISFDGGGLRLGLEAERYAACSGFMVYGHGSASFLAGEFRARYFQGSSFDTEEIDTYWKAGRLVPILDLEVGAGWESASGRWRLTAGYLFSAWLNTLQTDEWIDAVNANSFSSLGGETMTFDGLSAKAEYRF